MSNSGFGLGIATVAVPVLLALAFSYGTGRTIEVGDIKIGAVPQVEDPDMKRCKAAQASVENHVRIFGDIKNALELSMRATQEKEEELINIWSDMVKINPDDIDSQTSLVADINVFRERYSYLRNDVNDNLEYIGEILDYILRGCGLPARG